MRSELKKMRKKIKQKRIPWVYIDFQVPMKSRDYLNNQTNFRLKDHEPKVSVHSTDVQIRKYQKDRDQNTRNNFNWSEFKIGIFRHFKSDKSRDWRRPALNGS